MYEAEMITKAATQVVVEAANAAVIAMTKATESGRTSEGIAGHKITVAKCENLNSRVQA